MRAVVAFFLIALTAYAGSAERQWVNNITVDEYGMTWSYTETFTGADSIVYRVSIDEEFGDNDSFIAAWELLKTDKEMRKKLRSSIENEFDVRIKTPYLNTGINETRGIELADVDSALSPGIIGRTNISDTVVNRYTVTYRFRDSIFNAGSIWFLGQAGSPVTIIMPSGIDVTSISGMDNVTKNLLDRNEITGAFTEISGDRGEITLGLSRNTSVKYWLEVNTTEVILPKTEAREPFAKMLSKIRDVSILGAGAVIILLIYVFKLRKRT